LAAKGLDETVVFPIAEMIGERSEYIRLFFVFFMQYPLGWIMHYFVHGTLARHLYAIVLGVLIQLYMFGFEIIHVTILTGVAYILMAVPN